MLTNFYFVENITTTDTTTRSDGFVSHSTYVASETNKYDADSTITNTSNNGSTLLTYVACGVVAFLVVSIITGIFLWKQKGKSIIGTVVNESYIILLNYYDSIVSSIPSFINFYYSAKKSMKMNSEINDDYATRLSDHGDYDGLDYENSSNLRLNQESTETTVLQNPYYEGGGVIANNKVDSDFPIDVKNSENVKVVENPYYGET